MTPRQKIELKLVEARGRFDELMGKEERTEEEVSELAALTPKLARLKIEARAAIAAEPPPDETETATDDTEAAELRALIGKASLGAIVAATLAGRDPDGEAREVQQHLGLPGNSIPLDMLRAPVEQRDVTPAPADVGTMQDMIVPGVFPRAAASYLGVDMPTVGVGDTTFPIITTNAAAHSPDKGAPAAETTGSFAADALSPSRLQASFRYGVEDAARFAGMDAALRENLNMALADALDEKVLAGLLAALDDPDDPDAIATFDAYRMLLFSQVDGLYASEAREVRLLLGPATYAHASSVYYSLGGLGGEVRDVAALDSLQSHGGGARVSAHMPAPTADPANVATTLAARGMLRNAICPLWEGPQIIVDRVTKAAEGEVVLTVHMLYAFAVLRAAGFAKQNVKLA